MIDVQWGLLPAASANLGNALANGAAQIRQRRETATTRNALTNYLANPTDQAAFQGYAARDPRGAFQLRDEQVAQVRALRTDQQAMLRQAGDLLRNVRDEAGYQRALAAGRRAGIDITGAPPQFDPAFREEIVAAADALTPRTPEEEYTLGRGDIRYRGGREIARGAAPPSQVVAVAPGGTAEVIEQPWPTGPAPVAPAQQPPLAASSAPPAAGEAPAFATPTPAPGVDEPTLRRQAEAAIAAGRDPTMVWRRYQELLTGGGAASQAPQTFP